jgi:hypothetical protein
VVLGLLGQYVLSHLVADEDSTTAAEAPPISGALSVALDLLGLLGQCAIFPRQMAEKAGVSAAEAALVLAVLGPPGHNLFPHLMAAKVEMKEAGKEKKVALGLLG